MTNAEPDVFALQRFDARNWQLVNRRYAARDARHVIAWIGETGSGYVQVQWSGTIRLLPTYRTAHDALEDARRWSNPPRPGTAPIPIPHFPPQQQR